MSEDHYEDHFPSYWEPMIVLAALVSILSVSIELLVHVSHETEGLLHTIDFVAICLFVIDIIWKFKVYRDHAVSIKVFFRQSWLDIIAIIPFFRVFRIGRFARLARLSKATKTTKVLKATEKLASAGEHAAHASEGLVKAVEKGHKGVSGYAHGRHVKHGVSNEKHED